MSYLSKKASIKKKQKKTQKPKLHYNRHSWISKKMKMYMKQGVGHQVMKPR